jgi:hypothetical protein
MVLDKLLYHMRKQAWYKTDETPPSEGWWIETQEDHTHPIARPCSKYCTVM